jgi:hypothetical protein
MKKLRTAGFSRSWAVLVAAVFSTAAMPPISEQARVGLDRVIGTKGVYVSEESAYKFVFPRTDISVRVGRQRLSPVQAPVVGYGKFQTLATALRTTLDEVRRIRGQVGDTLATSAPSAPLNNTSDPTPLNGILSMRGAASDGIYRAAIGRIVLVNGTPIGREMGMSLKLSVFGTNARAFWMPI